MGPFLRTAAGFLVASLPGAAWGLAPQPPNADVAVNTTTASTQEEPIVSSHPDGDFMVVWQSLGQDAPAESARYGAYGRIFRPDLTPVTGELLVNSFTPNDQTHVRVAATTSGEFVVVWESDLQENPGSTVADYGIFAQRFAPTGARIGSEFRVNGTIAGNQREPNVEADANGNFVVVWQSPQDGSGFGVVARLYDANGLSRTGEIPVNTFTAGDQLDPDVAVSPNGAFVVTWRSQGQDGDRGGIYSQRFDAGGSRVGSEFRANSTTVGVQQSPMIGVNHDGAFVIIWESVGQDGDLDGLYGQFYGALGNPIGGETPITTYTTSYQEDPSIAANPDGDFMVTWESQGFDGSSDGVVGRRFTALGQPIDSTEFVIPFVTASSQRRGFVAADDLENFVVTWQGPDGSNTGIFVRKLVDSTPAQGPTPTPTPTPTGVVPTPTPTGVVPTPTPTGVVPTPTIAPPTPTPSPGGQANLCDGQVPTLVGTEGADTIIGTAGKDVIHGLGGNDRIEGLQGNDVICGGDGNDRLLGDAGADRIFGGNGDDILAGNGGNDALFGEAGNDKLEGGSDADQCIGGAGTNTFDSCETSS